MTAWPRTVFFALLCWLLGSALGFAQTVPTDDREIAVWSATAEARLKQIGSALESWAHMPPDAKSLAEVRQEVQETGQRAEKCISDFGARLNSVQEKLAALGEPDTGAAADIRAARMEFENDQQGIERQLALCRLIAIGVRDLADAEAQQRRKMTSRQLLHRERNIWQIFRNLLANGPGTEPAAQLSFDAWPSLGAGAFLLAILVPISLMLGRLLQRHFPIPERGPDAPPLRRTVLVSMYSRRAPWMATLLAVISTLHISGAAPVAAIGAALLISMALAPLIHLLACKGQLRCPAGLPARLLMDLFLVAGALMLVDAERFVPEHAYLLARGLFFFALALVALWLLRKLTLREDLQTLRSLRLPVAIALLAGPCADWLGYHNLGLLLTLGVYGTAAGVRLLWLLLSLVSRVYQALDDRDNETQPRLRQWLRYEKGEQVPGIGAIAWLIRIGALVALGYWLLFTWQVSDTSFVTDILHDGFNIGAIRIVPIKLIVALLAFSILLTLSRWLSRQLSERWLTKTKLDSGARQSVVSLTSYTIIGAAILLALSMAGLDFQNLAIVAGALSVGIGFGLQNIVNNFVSGLILLFERPVRPGDWVVVGATEGYVRKISIRYTLIQTFDRAEVLVPNSELISNQVTNLMLSDSYGRVTVPVGVAYGSDTQKVREILQKAVREHPMAVLYDPQVSAPRVYFMAFGDNSINFELRFFIQNIDYKLSVRSDILFTLDQAFREAGIEIPFPQRVVHMSPGTERSDGADKKMEKPTGD